MLTLLPTVSLQKVSITSRDLLPRAHDHLFRHGPLAVVLLLDSIVNQPVIFVNQEWLKDTMLPLHPTPTDARLLGAVSQL